MDSRAALPNWQAMWKGGEKTLLQGQNKAILIFQVVE